MLGLILGALVGVDSHAVLSDPLSRLGLPDAGLRDPRVGKKYTHATLGVNGAYPLQPRVLETCGDQDPGPKAVVKTYTVGDKITFKHLVTIAHPAQGQPEKVRLAIKYKENEQFSANVLFEAENNDISGSTSPGNGGEKVLTATAQLQKPCDKCTLQWFWDSQIDGGGYIDCADIKILAAIEACLEKGLDYPGNDLKNTDEISPEACQAKCGATTNCKFFSFANGKCYLKTAKSTPVQKGGFTSGPRACGTNNNDGGGGGDTSGGDAPGGGGNEQVNGKAGSTEDCKKPTPEQQKASKRSYDVVQAAPCFKLLSTVRAYKPSDEKPLVGSPELCDCVSAMGPYLQVTKDICGENHQETLNLQAEIDKTGCTAGSTHAVPLTLLGFALAFLY